MIVTKKQAQQRLTVLWFAGGGLAFVILIIQSMFGKYGDRVSDAWNWFLPNVLPTLSLIAGVLAAEASKTSEHGMKVNGFMYRLTFFVSLFYLLMMFLTVLLQPLVSSDPFKLQSVSNYWLGPMQGIVAVNLSVFFLKREG